jgi:hypothetical protein
LSFFISLFSFLDWFCHRRLRENKFLKESWMTNFAKQLYLVLGMALISSHPLSAQTHNDESEVTFQEMFTIPITSEDEIDDTLTTGLHAFSCRKANRSQISEIDKGNREVQIFLQQCAKATNNSPWCAQLIRPNPASAGTFQCTYGAQQPHQLIHPNPAVWQYAFKAVNLVTQLQGMGINPCLIYNWWRPEPYNKNVGGAKGRHPYGTSVDVRFCTMNDMERAHAQLCKWRKQGKLRAVGYYGSTALHFGIGDRLANTWGKSCPR